jgi:hypothetical protein
MDEKFYGYDIYREGFRCDYPNCTKLLSSKYNLKRHIESCHFGVRPYECSVCFKKFSSKQNKREHMRLHHSSTHLEPIQVPPGTNMHREMSVPKLTEFLVHSDDPDIRPLSKVERVYLYPEALFSYSLPPVKSERQQESKLPKFSAIS